MIQKTEHCTYCGSKMDDVKSAKRRFCTDKCRIYYGREIKRGSLSIPVRSTVIEAKFEAINPQSIPPNTIGMDEKTIQIQNEVHPKKKKTYEDYIIEKREMLDDEKLAPFLQEVENDSTLTFAQKKLIRNA